MPQQIASKNNGNQPLDLSYFIHKKFTRKVHVREYPIEKCVGDWEPRTSDLKQAEDRLFEEEILSKYDGLKRTVLERLFDGQNFLEIIQALGIKEGQGYKIKNELARDLRSLHDTDTFEIQTSVIKLFVLSRLIDLPRKIYSRWEFDNALSIYKRPSFKIIQECVEDILLGLFGGRVVYRKQRKIKRPIIINHVQMDMFSKK